MDVVIRRALPADARALTRVAHTAKRHWKYPEDWIRRWRDALTVTRRFVEHHPVYCVVHGARVLGFYGLSGVGPTLDGWTRRLETPRSPHHTCLLLPNCCEDSTSMRNSRSTRSPLGLAARPPLSFGGFAVSRFRSGRLAPSPAGTYMRSDGIRKS